MTSVHEQTAWLHGDAFPCLQPPTEPALRRWRLVLLGPPRSGKTEQARRLAVALGACPLSTSDVLRFALERHPGTALAEVLERMRHGHLVPDDVILDIVHNRRRCLRCSGGFLLDGFPRTLRQAVSFDAMLLEHGDVVDAVINYELPFADAVERAIGRRICPKCHAVYHVTLRPSFRVGLCDRCGSSLVRSPDDDPEAVHEQLVVFSEATLEVADHYRRQNRVITIDARGDPDTVFAATMSELEARFPAPEPPAVTGKTGSQRKERRGPARRTAPVDASVAAGGASVAPARQPRRDAGASETPSEVVRALQGSGREPHARGLGVAGQRGVSRVTRRSL